MIDFKDIGCPRCHKKYFKVKDYSKYNFFNTFPFVLEHTEEPIYKDGILINPKEPEFVKQYFQCIDCDCHFRTEDNGKLWRIVDEDKEHQELREKLEKLKKEKVSITKDKTITEPHIEAVKSNFTTINPNCTISLIDDKYATKEDVEKLEKLINEMSEEMKKRFRKLEESDKSNWIVDL